MPEEITSIQQIIDLARQPLTASFNWKDYGEVRVDNHLKYHNLLIFNYTNKAQYEGRWNFFERVSRGLIIDKDTGEIVARPFDKFFNWQEGGRASTAQIHSITEKIDGSLGILYRLNGSYRIATRGSFHSDQAEWATWFLHKHHDLSGLPNEYTLLFEIVYPENRVVIDYHGRANLTLLAVRDRFTGEYIVFSNVKNIIAPQYGFPTPLTYGFKDVDDLNARLPALPVNQEGYVVEFRDGQRFKFKGEEYKKLHKLISTLSFKNTLAAVQAGTVETIRAQIPPLYEGQFISWLREIETTVAETSKIVVEAFAECPKEGGRREFALWALREYPDYAPYLFAVLDRRDLVALIYKKAFANRHNDLAVEHDEDVA